MAMKVYIVTIKEKGWLEKELLDLVQAAPPNRCGLKHHHAQKIQSFLGAEKVEIMSTLIIEQTSTNISGKQNTLCQEPDVCIAYALCFVFYCGLSLV